MARGPEHRTYARAPTRRRFLRALGLGVGVGIAGTACGPPAMNDDESVSTLRYGDDPSQFLELSLPPAGPDPVPVAVIVHGGFWRSAYGLELGRPLAATLPPRGWAACNIEYRRLGNGGGFPQTFDDVAAAIDLVSTDVSAAAAEAGVSLDLDRIVAIGHSAGGHLAGWAATRPGQDRGAPGAEPAARLSAVVSQAGVLDLRRSAREHLGGDAAQALLGGEPAELGERYDLASPIERLPLGVPTLCIHAPGDGNVPITQSEAFVDAAVAAGDRAELRTVEGDHFVLIDPEDPAWTAVLDWIDAT